MPNNENDSIYSCSFETSEYSYLDTVDEHLLKSLLQSNNEPPQPEEYVQSAITTSKIYKRKQKKSSCFII